MRRVVGVEATGINACPCAQGLVRGKASERLLEAGFEASGRRADPRARPDRDPQPAGPRHALRRQRPSGERRAARGHRRRLDELADLRAAEAAGRAVRRRACAPAAAFRRGLRPDLAAVDARALSGAQGRGLRARAPAQLRDDPFARGRWRSATEPSASCGASCATASPPRGTPSYASGSRVLGRLNLKRFSVPARRRAMFGGAARDRDGGAGGERDHRPGLAEQHGRDRQRERRERSRRARRSGRRGRRRSRRPRRRRRRAARRRGTLRRTSPPPSRRAASAGTAGASARASPQRRRARRRDATP